MKISYTSINDSLLKIIKEVKIEHEYYETVLLTNWSNIVPVSISRVSKPLTVEEGKLHLLVTSELWKKELQLRKDDLLKLINANLANPFIKDIIFKG